MDAPLRLRVEMELLTLLFHSLWILRCNTVSADSIIHIGKTQQGGLGWWWWGGWLCEICINQLVLKLTPGTAGILELRCPSR